MIIEMICLINVKVESRSPSSNVSIPLLPPVEPASDHRETNVANRHWTVITHDCVLSNSSVMCIMGYTLTAAECDTRDEIWLSKVQFLRRRGAQHAQLLFMTRQE